MTDTPTFRYWRDPRWLAAGSLYLSQRLLVLLVSGVPTWWRGHGADLLLVPVGLPLWLWFERRVGWRDHDGMPTWREVGFVLVLWTISAEVLAPRLFAGVTADGWDAVAYATGAVLGLAAWRWTP